MGELFVCFPQIKKCLSSNLGHFNFNSKNIGIAVGILKFGKQGSDCHETKKMVKH